MFKRNPYEEKSDRQIRVGLIFTTLVYAAWLALSFSTPDGQFWFAWVIRGGVSLFLIYSWHQGLQEMKRRKRDLDQ
jgi:membrane protein implicated in regulation of membrane protease activity